MGFKIVVVDDNHDVLELIKECLDHLGCDVTAFGEPAAAVDFLGRHPVNALVTDFQMPGLNGVEVARAMRAADCNRHTQVVLISGAFRVLPAEFADAVDFFLPKPLQVAELGRVVAALRPSRLQEKRGSPRLLFETEVECRRGVGVLRARSLNVSETGMLLKAPETLSMDDMVQTSFRLLREAAVSFAARVVRRDRAGATGLEFVDLSPLQRRDLQAHCAMLAAT